MFFSKCRTWKGGSTHGGDALGGMAELLQGVLDAYAPSSQGGKSPVMAFQAQHVSVGIYI